MGLKGIDRATSIDRIYSAVGLSGLAKVFDNGVHKVQEVAKDAAQ